MTVFEALADGAFDHLNCQHTGNLTKLLQKKVNCPGICLGGRGGGHGRFWKMLSEWLAARGERWLRVLLLSVFSNLANILG